MALIPIKTASETGYCDCVCGCYELANQRDEDTGKGYCPAGSLPYENPPGLGRPGSEYAVCDQWHRFAINRINQLHPDLHYPAQHQVVIQVNFPHHVNPKKVPEDN